MTDIDPRHKEQDRHKNEYPARLDAVVFDGQQQQKKHQTDA